MTLLESGYKMPNKMDIHSFDVEGFSKSPEEEAVQEAREPPSPTSPLTHTIKKSAAAQPRVAIVHRVRLRNFQEGADQSEPGKIARRFSTGSSLTVCSDSLPLPQRRSSEPVLRSSSFERPQSAGPSVRLTNGQWEVDQPQVRQLESKEVARRSKEAVDWFRASRAINRKVRSIEDTDTLLAKARERRASGGAEQFGRKKSKEIPLGEPQVNPVKATEKTEEPRRRCVDPAALWAAKPLLAKPKEEEPKPVVVEKKSCMRGNVTVGQTGENGLLARLRRRKTVS